MSHTKCRLDAQHYDMGKSDPEPAARGLDLVSDVTAPATSAISRQLQDGLAASFRPAEVATATTKNSCRQCSFIGGSEPFPSQTLRHIRDMPATTRAEL